MKNEKKERKRGRANLWPDSRFWRGAVAGPVGRRSSPVGPWCRSAWTCAPPTSRRGRPPDRRSASTPFSRRRPRRRGAAVGTSWWPDRSATPNSSSFNIPFIRYGFVVSKRNTKFPCSSAGCNVAHLLITRVKKGQQKVLKEPDTCSVAGFSLSITNAQVFKGNKFPEQSWFVILLMFMSKSRSSKKPDEGKERETEGCKRTRHVQRCRFPNHECWSSKRNEISRTAMVFISCPINYKHREPTKVLKETGWVQRCRFHFLNWKRIDRNQAQE